MAGEVESTGRRAEHEIYTSRFLAVYAKRLARYTPATVRADACSPYRSRARSSRQR
jgi:hypothetical protein